MTGKEIVEIYFGNVLSWDVIHADCAKDIDAAIAQAVAQERERCCTACIAIETREFAEVFIAAIRARATP